MTPKQVREFERKLKRTDDISLRNIREAVRFGKKLMKTAADKATHKALVAIVDTEWKARKVMYE